jgi:hypothetical protein
VLVLGRTPWRSVTTSQLVSIASSLLVIIKASTELLTFQEDDPDAEAMTTKQKIVKFFKGKFQLIKNFFILFPFLFTSAVFNVGTIALAITVIGLHSITFLLISLGSHLALFYSVPLPGRLDQLLLEQLGLSSQMPVPSPGDQKKPLLTALELAWTNIFVLSCSVGRPKLHRATVLFCLQLVRLLLNLSIIAIILLRYGFRADLRAVGILSGLLGFCGVVFASLTCNASTSWLGHLKKRQAEGGNP